MGVRSAIADRLISIGKAWGGYEPPVMQEAARDVSQMTGPPFAPGEPVHPYDGYSRTAREFDFTTGYNIATRPRTHERVSFSTLRGLIEAYDVASICLWHRIDSIRSLDWKLVAKDGYSGDVSGAIALGMAALEKPDRRHFFKTWLAKWLYDVLAYDAGALERMRNRGGRCIGLRPVDGTTIAPLLDYWGDSPEDPAEAYVQFANGVPWNWLTRADLIYEPFRPRNNSPYGTAPLESILLNANTDLRFQVYFLQRFTEGNLPAAFASAPETWTPDEIERFQEYWDSFVYSDQSRKHQIRWIPGGSTFAWSNEKDFTDAFSLFLMRKTTAAFHVVPSDLGFTESVNRSSGESQADVQHRVGDLPLISYAEEVISRFLQDDLSLPLVHMFDRGEEQVDQFAQAQADGQYIDRGVVGPSEIRQMRYGLSEPAGQAVPRYIFTARSGPVPLASLYGVAGRIDPQTGAPDPGVPLPHEAFIEVPGVVPNPPLAESPLAEQEYGPKAIPPAPPPQQVAEPKATDAAHLIAKEGEGAAAGITSETGIYGYDGPGHRDDEDEDGHIGEDEAREALAKAELAAFTRFSKSRRRAGTWRDFEFAAVGRVRAHRLNDAGRLAVRKAAGEIAVAGLAVQAADTGRVLMLQRALADDDPAAGTWEFPGGHCEGDETPLQGAWREWAEETGCIPPPGAQSGSWTASNGIYQGFVWTVDSESSVPVRSGALVANPDDPDGDSSEAVAWWNPADLAGNPALRPELAADLGAVMAALGCGDSNAQGDESVCPCGEKIVFGLDDGDWWSHADGSIGCEGLASVNPTAATVAKAGDGGTPKAPSPDGAPAQQAWPGWDLDLRAAAYWSPLLSAAFLSALGAGEMAGSWLSLAVTSDATTKAERLSVTGDRARSWLSGYREAIEDALGDTLEDIRADGAAIGAASGSAAAQASQSGLPAGAVTADMGAWTPGASSVAREIAGGAGNGQGLRDLLRGSKVTIRSIAESKLDDLAKVLAEGVENGSSADDLAGAIEGLLSDPSKAHMIVLTELSRAMASAASWAYRFHGIDQVVLVTAEDGRVCDACDAAEAANPYELEDAPAVPLHPLCRCALVPV